MGFLQQFFQNVFQQSPLYQDYAIGAAEAPIDPAPPQSDTGREELELLLSLDTFGDFRLTDAIRPSLHVDIEPCQGYRHDVYRDEESGKEIPVIMAAASREVLFQLFMQLINRLGPSLDVVLETSHDHASNGHVDFYREQIDAPEVQFDEHKLLIVYGSPLEPFEHILEQHGVPCVPDMSFITEAEHVHTSSQDYNRQFDQLRTQLGIDADFGSTNIC